METSTSTFEVDDTSPLVTYTPFGDTFSTPNLAAGFNPYFNDTGFASSPGEIGLGDSLHITSFNGATVTIRFAGTAVRLYGNFTNASASFTLDQNPMNGTKHSIQSDGVLVDLADLDNTEHSLQMTAQTTGSPDSLVVFDKAQIKTTRHDLTAHNATFPENQLAFSGKWTFEDSPNPSHSSNSAGDLLSFTITNSTAVFIFGRTSISSGNYSVNLDNQTTSYSARSSFNAASLLFYASGLDPSVPHEIQLSNSDGGSLSVDENGVVTHSLTNLSSSSPVPQSTVTSLSAGNSPSYPAGTIAALALAGVLAFLILCASLFYAFVYRPRRRELKRKLNEPGRRPIDKEAGTDFTTPASRRTSRFTGFARWREEVETGLGGLGNIGITFRNSDDEKVSDPMPQATASNQRRTVSLKSSISSLRNKLRRNGTPSSQNSFKVDLHVHPFRDDLSGQSESAAVGHSRSVGSEPTSLEYVSSPSSSNERSAPRAKQRRSNGDSTSSSAQSYPRNVARQISRPAPYPNTHSRENSRGPLLMDPASGFVLEEGDHPPSYSITEPSGVRRDGSDRGSTYTDEDQSVLGTNIEPTAVRSLSPQFSRSYARDIARRSGSPLAELGRDAPRVQFPSSRRRSSAAESADPGGPYLNVNVSSPFQVQFSPRHSQHPPTTRHSRRSSDLSRVRFEDDEPLSSTSTNQPGAPELVMVTGKISSHRPQIAVSTPGRSTSFLDLDGSASKARPVSQQTFGVTSPIATSRTRKLPPRPDSTHLESDVARPGQPQSRWSSTTAAQTSDEFSSGASRDASSSNQSADISVSSSKQPSSSSASFPFPVSLPSSPQRSQFTEQSGNTEGSQQVQTQLDVDNESELDSVPRSISDIDFRHSESESTSSRGASVDAHLPGHPPLPRAETPNIVATVLGHSRSGTLSSMGGVTAVPSALTTPSAPAFHSEAPSDDASR